MKEDRPRSWRGDQSGLVSLGFGKVKYMEDWGEAME